MLKTLSTAALLAVAGSRFRADHPFPNARGDTVADAGGHAFADTRGNTVARTNRFDLLP